MRDYLQEAVHFHHGSQDLQLQSLLIHPRPQVRHNGAPSTPAQSQRTTSEHLLPVIPAGEANLTKTGQRAEYNLDIKVGDYN